MMGCLGVHFALDSADEQKLLSLHTDQERAAFVQEDVEERYFAAKEDGWACESDKAWDAMHRCFDKGQLTYDAASPLQMAVLGGRPLYEGGDYIIVHKSADDVIAIADALKGVTEVGMRTLYDAIDPADYGVTMGNEDWEYTWYWFERVREFYGRAASSGRAVIFTADQ